MKDWRLSGIKKKNPVAFVLLNPITADVWHKDPTVERCQKHALSMEFGDLKSCPEGGIDSRILTTTDAGDHQPTVREGVDPMQMTAITGSRRSPTPFKSKTALGPWNHPLKIHIFVSAYIQNQKENRTPEVATCILKDFLQVKIRTISSAQRIDWIRAEAT